MPPKGYQSFGDEMVPVGTRIPRAWIQMVEDHVKRLRIHSPNLRVSQSDALRDLIAQGLQAVGSDTTPQHPTGLILPVDAVEEEKEQIAQMVRQVITEAEIPETPAASPKSAGRRKRGK
jgi:hypothetical protein